MEVTLFVISFLISMLAVYICTGVVKWYINRNIMNKLPGPRSHYIIGNWLDVIGTGTPDILFKNLRRISSQYNIYRLWMGYIGAANLKTPEDIEILISSTDNLEKSPIYGPLLPWLNTGLLTSSGKKWHSRRKMLTPAFHFSILQQFVKVFADETDKFLIKIEKECRQPFVNIEPLIAMFTLGCVCETSMGTTLNENDAKQMGYKKSIYELGALVIYRVVTPIVYPDWIFFFTPAFWKQLKIVKILHSFTLDVIKQREKNFTETVTSKLDDQDFAPKKKLAMLDLMLSAKKNGFAITDDGIREEVDTIMFEAHDTLSTCLCFTLMLLANYPEVQQKAYEELIDLFDDSNRQPTYADLQNLPYLEMCVKESLRLYPSVPLISRLTSKDITTFTGYRIPKGNIVHVHIYDLHHNPDVFSDPEKFDPDRFLPENCVKRHPFAYLPFSGGPRNCIGQRYAFLEIKTLLSGILRKYKLIAVDTPNTIILYQDMVLRPKNGIKIQFVQRNAI